MTELKRMRLESGLKVDEMSTGTGIPLGSYQRYEQGRGDISLARAVNVSNHLSLFLPLSTHEVLKNLVKDVSATENLQEAA